MLDNLRIDDSRFVFIIEQYRRAGQANESAMFEMEYVLVVDEE